MQEQYSVGIYARLSRDDERAGESVSIENQKEMLARYVRNRAGRSTTTTATMGSPVRPLLGLDSDTFYIYHVTAVMVDNLRRLLLGINLSDKAVMDFDFRVLVSRSNSCIKIRSINSWTFS